MQKSLFGAKDRYVPPAPLKVVSEPLLLKGDCLDILLQVPDGSIDAIICDPPYGTMLGIEKSGHYKPGRKESHEWDETIEHAPLLFQCNRVLRPNGALVLFSQEPYTSKLITEAHSNVPFSYRLSWLKDHFANALSSKKAPVNYVEDICVFFKKYPKHDHGGEHPLRPYASQLLASIGRTKKELCADLGHQGIEHFTRHKTSQFNLCTERTYGQLIFLYGIDKLPLFKDFEYLKKADSRYREALIIKMTRLFPKIFNLPPGKKYRSNVLEYKKDYEGLHPTQKPVELMADLVATYTDEGDTVLDFTMGSGTTGVACRNLKRTFIGIERDEKYYDIAVERINKTQ